jgi:tRNA-dihydrouridine synthase B
MIPSLTIGAVSISPGLVLSPMSGVTNSAFRRLIKEYNPGAVGLLVSEFISVEGMTREGRRSLEMMQYDASERPYCIQIFGYDIQRMRDAAVMVEQAGADIVDINCGCPAPKVVRKGGGCELMRQPDHLAGIIREVRKAVRIPLTIKIRSGWDESSQNAVSVAQMAEAEGIDAIAVHGRTRAALYRGEADWQMVREVVEAVKIPVCGSGDVDSRAAADARLNQSGAAGIYIGRAALYNPLVFSEVLSGQPRDLNKNPRLQTEILNRYIALLLETVSAKCAIGRVKQLASQMSRGHPWAKALCRAETLDCQIEILRQVVATEFPPNQGMEACGY